MLEKGQLVSDWHGAEEIVPNLTEGDLLEFRRTARIGGSDRQVYTHWAVYIGEVEGIPKVVHKSTPDGDFDVTSGGGPVACSSGSLEKVVNGSKMATVRCDLLSHVAGEDQLRINNGQDRTHTAFSPQLTVQRALDQLGTGDYNFVMNNCEHFCKHCRYDNKISSQVVNGTALAVGSFLAIAANPLLGVGAGVALHVLSEPVSRLFNRK